MGLFGNTNTEDLPIPVTIGGEYRSDAVLIVESGVIVETALINLAKKAHKEGFSRVMNVRVVGNFENNFDAYGDAVK